MAKKQDAYYFNNFCACVNHAVNASHILKDTFTDFHPDLLEEKLREIHIEEHSADQKKHEVLNELIKAFITPIEREDIIELTHRIDDLVDKVEDVLLRVYCHNIQTIRPDAVEITAILVRSCEAVSEMMKEFSNYKRSKTLKETIISINSLEGEADILYLKALRNLHTTCNDPMEIMAWHELYTYLEKCMDTCEHIADTVETVIMKNS